MNLIINEFQVITTSRDDISPGFYRPHKTLRLGFICLGFELPLGSHPQIKPLCKLRVSFPHTVQVLSDRM